MDPTTSAILAAWSWRWDVAVVVAGFGIAYVTGWRRLRRPAVAGAPGWRLALYLGGLAAVVLAVFSPISRSPASSSPPT